ncbi:hypothetical protein HU200_011629 [Digitaria exilis]|uniref:HTH OST-type domain-containing protein n=1 Tax=Digitaria exilis TaxID=1010633 RepID=A0A835FGC7_9POAL|nr:hypothetical protein HU200_011629 [Digitaria exilis]
MSQILLRRLSAHSLGARSHGCRRLSSAVYGGGGERRRPSAQAPQEEESRAVRVAVWWDFENCNIPNGVNVCRLAPRVAAAVRAAGIRGPLSITAFGDVLQLARSSQEALAATGVSISHVPRSGKNSSDRSFMADLVYWIAQNPPPVHFFLISGDTDFANLLHRLRMSNYNVLLACPSYATSVLCSASTFMWQWDALVKGEDFSPKHFNHPPDGLHGSWYGYYKGALDDPFLEKESREPIKVPSDSQLCSVPSDTKHCSIPNYVTNAIVEALRLNPKGMRLSLLREELTRNNVYMGTDFFGHKKFTCLLQSMPDIVELIDSPPGENQQYAILANKRLQSGDGSSKTLSSAQRNVRENNFTQGAQNDKYPSLMSTPEAKPQSPSESVDRSRSLTETVSEIHLHFLTHLPLWVRNAVNKDGLLKRIWVLWNGPENAESKVSQNCESTSTELVDDLRIPLQKHSADHRVKLPISSDGEDSENMKRDPSLLENLEPCSRPASVSRSKAGEKDSSEKNEGLFTWASRWWTSGKSDAGNSTTKNVVDETTDSNEEFESSNASAGGRGQQLVNEYLQRLTCGMFWSSSYQNLLGLSLFQSENKSKLLALNPMSFLKSILVDGTLITLSILPYTSNNGYRVIVCKLLKEKSIDEGKPQKGKYADDNSRRNKLLTREEILSDCHKLLKELLSQHKYGFNISIFKRIFAQKHGYELDHQMLGKLGYPDLASLLQIMPDARIKFPRRLTRKCATVLPLLQMMNSQITTIKQGNNLETHAEHSSLLQIIDSWNSSKDDGSSKKSQDIDGLVDCSKSNLGSLDNLTAENLQRPTRPLQKQYSFVSDSEEGKEKDKLVESVLGSLQKARSSKLRN